VSVAAAQQPGDAPPPAARTRRGFTIALLAIVAAGVAVRVLYTLLEAPWPPPTLDDQFYFSGLGKLLASGHGFIAPFKFYFHGTSLPTAEHPPLYPIALAGLDALVKKAPAFAEAYSFLGMASRQSGDSEGGRRYLDRAGQQLARDADVAVSSYRPGTAERLGAGYGTLSGLNPPFRQMSLTRELLDALQFCCDLFRITVSESRREPSANVVRVK